MASLKKELLAFIRTEKLFAPADPILLAVSGGIDSMVMLSVFHECELNFGIAHVNFKLRGKESDADEAFVRQTADHLRKQFHVTHFSTGQFAAEKKISIQMAARELRYEWLEQIRRENGYHKIAVAHQLDDSIETVLLNMFRGTGILGLKGIAPLHGKIVRPLLCFRKAELLEYAIENKVAFREDASNLEVDYERNKIRLEVIPSIKKHFPFFENAFSGNIQKWKDAAALYDEALKRIKRNLLEERGEEIWISIPGLQQLSAYKTILYEVLKDYAFNAEQIEMIVDSFGSESGKSFLSPTHRIIKDRKHLIISSRTTGEVSQMLIGEEDKRIHSGNLELRIYEKDSKDFSVPKDSLISCLDKKELQFPLVLRKWKKGDYFYPFGMKKKKKKISDYLIDRKIPLTQKENTWVIETGKRIACIVGERIDERFKITPSTEVIYIVEKK